MPGQYFKNTKNSFDDLRQVPRLPLLDVLRILALLQVSLFHQRARLIPSGYLAVLSFFILSAYLLFRAYLWRRFYKHLILSSSYQQRISFKACDESLTQRLSLLLKQLAKLYLPFVLMLVVVSSLLAVFYPEYLAKQAATLRASILGVNNYQQLWQGQSYFSGAGFLSAFTHIWALSVEWQYYLFLFLLFIPLYQQLVKWRFRRLCLLLATISQLILWLVAFSAALRERVYFASFMRSMPFLIGLFLATSCTASEYKQQRFLYMYQLYRDKQLLIKARNTCKLSLRDARLLASVSFAFLILLPFLPLNLQSFYLWQGLIYTLALAVFIFSALYIEMWACLPKNKKLDWRTKYARQLIKLSVYSYHFYLWHYPVQAFIAKASANLSWSVWLFDLLSLTISAVISYASYRVTVYLEKQLKSNVLRYFCVCLAFIMLCLPYAQLGQVKQAELDAIANKITNYEKMTEHTVTVSPKLPKPSHDVQPSFDINKLQAKNLPLTDNVLSEEDRQYLAQFESKMLTLMQNKSELSFDLTKFEQLRLNKYTLIGDSIGIFLSFFVNYYLPNAQLDVHSTRKFESAADVYTQAKNADKLGDAVIALFGTNGNIRTEEIEKLYNLVKQDNKPLFLTSVVLPWVDQESENNKLLRNFVKEHSDCYLIDWHKYAKNNSQYFETDSIHPSSTGCELYMHLICKALVEALGK